MRAYLLMAFNETQNALNDWNKRNMNSYKILYENEHGTQCTKIVFCDGMEKAITEFKNENENYRFLSIMKSWNKETRIKRY